MSLEVWIPVIVTALGFLYQWFREARAHRWAHQERVRIAQQMSEKIDENTDISRKAFEEANSLNKKIAEITKQFTDVKQDVAEAEDREEARFGKR